MSDALGRSNTMLAHERPRAAGFATGALRRVWRFMRRKRAGAFGLVVALCIIVIGAFAPLLTPYSKDATFSRPNPKYDVNSFDEDALNPTILARLEGPSSAHPLGTDDAGRDLLTRIILGARLAVQVGIGAAAFSALFGTLIGIICGYFGGLVDLVVQRFVDAMIAIPPLVLLLLFVQISKPSLRVTIIALGFLGIFNASRFVRSAALAVRKEPYLEAARAIGVPAPRIMVRHVLPNVAAPIIVIFTIAIGANILAESGLAFLNLGVPGPSWGQMVNLGRKFIGNRPMLSLVSGGAITLTVLSFNLFGDALRDVLDPRQRAR